MVMKVFCKSRIILKNIMSFVLVLTSLSVMTFHISYASEGQLNIEDKIESTARQLLKDIFEKRYENILSIIPDNGLQVADGWINKKTIETSIFKNSSYLHRKLYSIPSDRELNICKKAGSFPVSPFYFYMKNSLNYTVKVIKRSDKMKLYKVVFKQAGSKDECRLVLFSAKFILKENKVFLYSYFFNF